VLEHIPDDGAAIAELARVLRPGGRAILMVPFDPNGPTQEGAGIADPAERMRRFGHPYHYRINGRDFPGRLDAAGLAPIAVDSRACAAVSASTATTCSTAAGGECWNCRGFDVLFDRILSKIDILRPRNL
jgi:SAM-dependent methyltransferase